MATRVTQKTVLAAARQGQGNVSVMAQILGVSVATVYRYIDRWPKIRAAIESERVAFDTQVKDTARERLLKAVKADRWAAILYALQKYVEPADDQDDAQTALAEEYSEGLERVYGNEE